MRERERGVRECRMCVCEREGLGRVERERERIRFEREWDERVNGSKEKRGRREKSEG